MQTPPSYLDNLTPLRGITALLVAVYHFEDLMVRFVPDATSMFLGKCYLMVDIFFIMSGFIITHVYQETFRHLLAVNAFKRFIRARFARIYPMHLFMLLVIVASFIATGSHSTPIQDPKAIPTNLLLIHSFGIHNTFTWNVPSWSISAEWWCYICFPFIILFLNSNKKIAILVLFVFSLLGYLSIMYWLPRAGLYSQFGASVPHDLNVTFDFGFIRGLSGFIAGMLLYKLYEMPSARKIFSADWLFVIFALAAIACMHFAVPDIYCIPLFASIVICVACNSGVIHKAFQLRFLQLIGNISYSIYMLHVVVIFMIIETLNAFGIALPQAPHNDVPFWPGLLGCVGFLAIVIILSALTYRAIERPCRDFLNRKSATVTSVSFV